MKRLVTTNGSDLFENFLEKEKKCTICQLDLPISAFGTDGGANYLRYECRECARKNSALIRDLKKRTPKALDDHRCPICQRNKEDISQGKADYSGVWCLDHDHIGNTFRGWLCHKCNLGLGNMGDDIGRLEAAVRYLKQQQTGTKK